MKGLVLLSLMLGMFRSPAIAAAMDYDGTWNLDGSCAADPSRKQPGFEYHWTTAIENSAFSRTNVGRLPDGRKTVDEWSAVMQGASIAITVKGSDDRGARWLRKYTGNAINGTEITISGDYFLPTSPWGWQKTRTCAGVFTLVNPNPGSLAGNDQKRRNPTRPVPAPLPVPIPASSSPPMHAPTSAANSTSIACQKFPNLCP